LVRAGLIRNLRGKLDGTPDDKSLSAAAAIRA
jgi:hypothetical protein